MGKVFRVLNDPFWAIDRFKEKYLTIPKYKKIHVSSLKHLLSNLGYDFNEYTTLSEEFLKFSEVHDFVNQQFNEKKIKKSFPPDKYSWPVLLYFIIRKTNPKIVIETGCWYGNSSVCILAALNKNGTGKLFTIDLPAYFESGGYYDENPYLPEELRISSLPEGAEPGFIIPDLLKKRWQLIIGSTKEKLIPLLRETGNVDIFLHDSLHSYDNMKFEFTEAYNYLNKGGLLVSDNIDWNSLFKDFSMGKESYSYLAYYESPLLKNNFGLIVKE